MMPGQTLPVPHMSENNRYVFEGLLKADVRLCEFASGQTALLSHTDFIVMGKGLFETRSRVELSTFQSFAVTYGIRDSMLAEHVFKKIYTLLKEKEAKDMKEAARKSKQLERMQQQSQKKSKSAAAKEYAQSVNDLFIGQFSMKVNADGSVPAEPLIRAGYRTKGQNHPQLWLQYKKEGSPYFREALYLGREIKDPDVSMFVTLLSDMPCPWGACSEDCEFPISPPSESEEIEPAPACQAMGSGPCSMGRCLRETYGRDRYLTEIGKMARVFAEKNAQEGEEKYPVVDCLSDVSAFRRFTHSRMKTPECPEWNKILSRCSCPWSFAMWFGKLATPGDRGRQALILWGGGKTGNTVIAKALEQYFAGISCAEPEAGGGKFTLKESAGYLLSMVNDVSNHKYLFSDEFKKRTGGDTQRGEEKFANGMDVDYFAKLLVTTNHALKIDPLCIWSTSRVLPIKMAQIAETDRCSNQEEIIGRLKEELPAFIHACRSIYVSSGINGDIPITEETSKIMYDMELSIERDLADWVIRKLHPCNEVKREIENGEAYLIHEYISEKRIRTEVNTIRGKIGEQRPRYDDFKISNISTFIERTYGIKQGSVWVTAESGNQIPVNGFFGLTVLDSLKSATRISRFNPQVANTFGLNLDNKQQVYQTPQHFASLEDLL
jgi:hypothetical protein